MLPEEFRLQLDQRLPSLDLTEGVFVVQIGFKHNCRRMTCSNKLAISVLCQVYNAIRDERDMFKDELLKIEMLRNCCMSFKRIPNGAYEVTVRASSEEDMEGGMFAAALAWFNKMCLINFEAEDFVLDDIEPEPERYVNFRFFLPEKANKFTPEVQNCRVQPDKEDWLSEPRELLKIQKKRWTDPDLVVVLCYSETNYRILKTENATDELIALLRFLYSNWSGPVFTLAYTTIFCYLFQTPFKQDIEVTAMLPDFHLVDPQWREITQDEVYNGNVYKYCLFIPLHVKIQLACDSD